MMDSRDGFQWNEKEGLKAGVPSIGVIHPPSNLCSAQEDVSYDVIVVGAGYCGLTAARDITTSGLRVLLLEARDRIGGRSWSSNIGGYPFEMGGTWVNWGQAHVWREISRYQMCNEIEISQEYSFGVNNFSLTTRSGTRTMSHDEEDAIVESALQKFVNVDGRLGKNVMPFPNDAEHNPAVRQWDRLSASDRISQIADSLTLDERTALEGFLLLCSGGTLSTMSFFEFLHWWALSGYSYEGCIEYLMKYKFRGGQSSFAIRFWQEASATKNLSYSFNCPITQVEDSGTFVQVTGKDGRKFRAARMICTIPLNVLKTIRFEPPLNHNKQAAADIGHVNQCVKVHAEVRDKDLRSWSTINHPTNELIYAFGDGTTPAGNTHIVAFGARQNHIQPDENMNETMRALQSLTRMDIQRVVFHNWSRDEYANGAWFFPPKDFMTRYHEALRSRQGNIFFANSDWAVGWRSFIDGAIEEGTRAAFAVPRDLA